MLQLVWILIHPEHAYGFTESPLLLLLIEKQKYKPSGELINKRYYKQGKDAVKADVIVFGHTHVPELRPPLEAAKGKAFVNTGSWIEGTLSQYDTFAYIDEDGPQLLQWDDGARITREFEER